MYIPLFIHTEVLTKLHYHVPKPNAELWYHSTEITDYIVVVNIKIQELRCCGIKINCVFTEWVPESKYFLPCYLLNIIPIQHFLYSIH